MKNKNQFSSEGGSPNAYFTDWAKMDKGSRVAWFTKELADILESTQEGNALAVAERIVDANPGIEDRMTPVQAAADWSYGEQRTYVLD